MTLTFYIAHTSPGRTRIRWAGDASEKGRIIQLAAEIEKINAVVSADPRMTTGSIVIEHDGIEWSSLQTQLSDQLSMVFPPIAQPMKRSGAKALSQSIDNLDGALNKVNMDFDSLTLLMLSTFAIIQALRGQIIGSSSSFLWYAFNLAVMARNRTDKPGDEQPETTE